MKRTEDKLEFIQLRAEGNSYSTICKILHIAKATCTSWERELSNDIEEAKAKQLKELAESYGMAKEARIKKLGETLGKINTAVDALDFSTIQADKLLALQLQYTEALKEEYSTINSYKVLEGSLTPQTILGAFTDLLNRVRAGEVTTEQANRESIVISNLLKAYDTAEVKAKIDSLEEILESAKN